MIRMLSAFAIGALLCVSLRAQQPNSPRFEQLKDPRISIRKNQRMIVVEANGDPNSVGPKAFSLLYQLYYTIAETAEGPPASAPRVRGPACLDAPESEWVVLYALPVPENVTELPHYVSKEGFKVSLATWEYGEVGEILYTGTYHQKEPAIKRLLEFIENQRYVAIGGREEEYLRGPTIQGPGDPESYLTIIRYRVKDLRRLIKIE